MRDVDERSKYSHRQSQTENSSRGGRSGGTAAVCSVDDMLTLESAEQTRYVPGAPVCRAAVPRCIGGSSTSRDCSTSVATSVETLTAAQNIPCAAYHARIRPSAVVSVRTWRWSSPAYTYS